MEFWDFFWLLIWSFFFVMYLMVLFHIFGDLFRDRELSGGAKALWTIGLILVPFLVMLIYLIVRGRGMAERQAGAIRQAQAETDRYIQVGRQLVEPDRPDLLGEVAARQRVDHAGRVRPAEGNCTRLIKRGSAACLGLGRDQCPGVVTRSSHRSTTTGTCLGVILRSVMAPTAQFVCVVGEFSTSAVETVGAV